MPLKLLVANPLRTIRKYIKFKYENWNEYVALD